MDCWLQRMHMRFFLSRAFLRGRWRLCLAAYRPLLTARRCFGRWEARHGYHNGCSVRKRGVVVLQTPQPYPRCITRVGHKVDCPTAIGIGHLWRKRRPKCCLQLCFDDGLVYLVASDANRGLPGLRCALVKRNATGAHLHGNHCTQRDADGICSRAVAVKRFDKHSGW